MLVLCVHIPKISTTVLIGHAKTVLAAQAVLILCVHSRKISTAVFVETKFSTAVLEVRTKNIVLAFQAVLILCVHSHKISTAALPQLCTAKK